MFETVVIATDGSESAERAVDAALDLSERFDAALHALTVIENSSETESDNGENDTQQAKHALDDLAARMDGDVHTVIKEGDPATVICSYAEQVDAGVVVTGTRGRNNPHGFHLGSVAEAVVHDCPVPVLTVRQLYSTAEPSDGDSSNAPTTDSNHEVL